MGKQADDNCDVRIDKWLWSVRLYKTRSLAAEACRKGRVIIDDIGVKPSKVVKKGDIVRVVRPPAQFTYRVKDIVNNRQPAKLVDNYLENLTSEEEKAKLTERNLNVFSGRPRGKGRPTKRERRDIDKFRNSG